MTGERTTSRTSSRRGMLTAAALASGLREQSAFNRGSDRVTIELRHDPVTKQFIVSVVVLDNDGIHRDESSHTGLVDARQAFRDAVSTHKR